MLRCGMPLAVWLNRVYCLLNERCRWAAALGVSRVSVDVNLRRWAMELQKKAWVTPELIVLLRGRPEEAILQGCKGGDWDVLPGSSRGTCYGATCEICSSVGSS
jgi:hypothetical protein